MRLKRLVPVLAAICAASTTGCSDALIGPHANADNGAVFDEMWHQFDLHYSFFELKQVNWDSLGAHYRPLALAASTDQAFATVLSRMLSELRDVHVSVTPTGAVASMRYLSAPDTAATYYSESLVFRRYVTQATTSAGGHVRYGMLAPTVGYLRISSFEGSGWAPEVDAALAQMSAATRLVIDVRNNSGGKYGLAADIAGRFADRSRVFGYVRYRNGQKHSDFTPYVEETVAPSGPRQFLGPVYVLTNRKDFSSAEDFVLAMSVSPATTVVGDTTAGASGGPMARDLPNGWSFQLSEWIEYTVAKRTFEGVGLAPNVVVKSTPNDLAREVDAVLERVLTLTAR